ncbi:MAG: acyl-CoA dehydrogenase family protein [Deltaproteobacteria bacterium]|nr:acyl-CoA dehydrogenase family protein [Deltaproteobacteria bacterium]
MSRLTDEHKEIRRAVREFVEREVDPIADELDNAEKEIPMPVIRKMAELGYFGLIFPTEYGGMGLDTLSMAIVTEELSRGWLSVGSVMTRMIITGSLIQANGTEEQKRRFLPRISSGELLTAAAFTEPDVGSDTAAMKLRATKSADGKNYELFGEKTWCTFANRAHVLTVLARTNPEVSPKHKGLSILLVEKEPGDDFHSPSLTGGPIPTIGYKGMKSYALGFDGYPCPKENLLGGAEGRGFYQLMATYEYARIQTAARAVGVAQAALDAAIKYARERTQFGKPIAEHQIIRHKIAHIATDLEAARQLCYYAATCKDEGRRCDLEAGYAKAFGAEMAERVTTEALQVFGGYGYSREYPAQRFWRDARVFRIFEGTSEIQYEVIAKRLLDEGR